MNKENAAELVIANIRNLLFKMKKRKAQQS
jgi:hypothetical protein